MKDVRFAHRIKTGFEIEKGASPKSMFAFLDIHPGQFRADVKSHPGQFRADVKSCHGMSRRQGRANSTWMEISHPGRTRSMLGLYAGLSPGVAWQG
jgi:hypothetical protein